MVTLDSESYLCFFYNYKYIVGQYIGFGGIISASIPLVYLIQDVNIYSRVVYTHTHTYQLFGISMICDLTTTHIKTHTEGSSKLNQLLKIAD